MESRVVIHRIYTGDNCEWCAGLAGTYVGQDWDDIDDAFQRHSNCNCIIDAYRQTSENGKSWKTDTKSHSIYNPSPQKQDSFVQGELEKLRKQMKRTVVLDSSSGDPIASYLGAARNSHPERVEEILKWAKRNSVVVEETDRNVIAYMPELPSIKSATGVNGRMLLNRNASIGAWEHELIHAMDDAVGGFHSAFSALQSYKELWAWEKRGYAAEIKVARQISDKARSAEIEQSIRDTMEQRRQEIWNEYYGRKTWRNQNSDS